MPRRRKSNLGYVSRNARSLRIARQQESSEDAEIRRIKQAERQANIRVAETLSQSQARLRDMAERMAFRRQQRAELTASLRASETFEERHMRRFSNTQHRHELRQIFARNTWKFFENCAFDYDPTLEYSSLIKIDHMNMTCRYCGALKWKEETEGMCCSGGKIKTEEPDPDSGNILSINPVIIVDQFEIEQESVPDERDNFNNSEICSIPHKLTEEEKPTHVNEMVNKNAAKNNYEIQILRRSKRIEERKKVAALKEKIAVLTNNSEHAEKKRQKGKITEKNKNNTCNLRNNAKTPLSRSIMSAIETVPESIVRISTDGGRTIISFKVRESEELIDIPEENLTPIMKKMLLTYLDCQAQKLRNTHLYPQTESTFADSNTLNVPPKKLQKQCIQKYKELQMSYFQKSILSKESNCRIETKLTI